MPTLNEPALDFLLTRRSRPARTLSGPAPVRAQIETLLTVAARTPDHGKLEPWRFVVLSRSALDRLAALVEVRGAATGRTGAEIDKMRSQFADSPLAVAVVSSPVESDKVPPIEQTYSAGAVCYGLLSAALAAGWGANWLTGWAAYDREFLAQGLGLQPQESIVGFVHIGTETATPPDRPRPDLSRIVTWAEA